MIRCQFNKHNEGSVKPPAVNFILNIFNRFKRSIRILKTTTESNFFKVTCRADPMYFEKLDIALDDNIASQFYEIESLSPDTKTYIFQVVQERVKHKIQCYGSELSTLDVLKQVLGKATFVSNNTFVWQYQSDSTFNDACKKLDTYEKEHRVDLDYAAESTITDQDVKIPGTDIILEKGDKIIWKEAADSKPKFICVSGEKDLKDSVKLPDRVVLTNNGAFDLEQKGKSGWYVWVGYEHKGWKSEPTMQSIIARTAEEVGRWMSKTYTGKYNVDNLWKTLDMFRVWVEDTNGKIQKELDHKKNEAQVLEDSGLIERKVVFDEPLFKYIIEYRSESYGGRINYYHQYDIIFDSKFEKQLRQFGLTVYFRDSGRDKRPGITFSNLYKHHDMEDWLKTFTTVCNIVKKVADYNKTYAEISY